MAIEDNLTDEERKFMDSRGETGLEPEPETPALADVPEIPAEGQQMPAAPEIEAGASDDDDDAEPPVDPRTGKKPPRQVNYNKYRRLQEDYDNTTKQLSDLREIVTRSDERMKIINEALSAPTQEQQEEQDQDPAPDPTQDVFGYLAWQNREMQRMQQRFDEQISGFREQVETRHTTDDAVTTYRQDAERFAQTQPAFAHAYNYLINSRLNELEAMGYTDRGARERMIVEEEFGQVQAAIQRGISPAQQIYNLAVGRGFRPGAAAPSPAAAPAPAAAQTRQAAAGGSPPTAGKPNVAAIIDAVTNGQAAAQSLSRGGGAPADTLTPEVLANMSDEDFGTMMDRLPKSRLRELLPGA
jgi:hypothetical protein